MKKAALVSFVLITITTVVEVRGQGFTEVSIPSSIGVYNGRNIWFDYDNDGDLDFFATGATGTNNSFTALYQNNAQNGFVRAGSPFNVLPLYTETNPVIFDSNGDDRIDVLLVGRGVPNCSILENTITGFVNKGPLPDIGNTTGFSAVAVGDTNRDGIADVFISGTASFAGGNPTNASNLYLGTSSNQFQKTIPSGVTGLYNSYGILFDVDNDADLDLLVGGRDVTFPYQVTSLYKNDGLGNFVLAQQNDMVQLQNTFFDVADYDADHDLDVVMTGLNDLLVPVVLLYKNTNGHLAQVPISTPAGAGYGTAVFGDFDNDGDSDILISGSSLPSVVKMTLLRNDGADQFTTLSPTVFPAGVSNAAWGDADGDGDLDIAVSGSIDDATTVNPYVTYLRNEATSTNLPPAKPLNVTTTKNASTYSISWNQATDDHTPGPGLTYNVSLLNTSNNQYRLAPYSHPETGKRKVAQMGNNGVNTNYKVDLPDGSYAVKIQAVDGSFLGSAWSDQQSIYVGNPAPPSNLALSYKNGNIELTWLDNSVNEQYFVIERRVNSGLFTKLDSVGINVSHYSDPISGSDHREYRVSAVNPNKRSAPSTSIQTQLISPSNIGLQYVNNSLKLSWVDNAYNEAYYIIERNRNNQGFAKLDSVSANVQSYLDVYTSSDKCEYRVYARNLIQKSASLSIVTSVDVPTDLTALFLDGKPKLTWLDKSYNEQYFVIERGLNNIFKKIDSVASNVTSYTDVSLVNGSYSYRIYATNKYQRSDYTPVQTLVVTGLANEEGGISDIYPNPVVDLLTINLPGRNNQDVQLSVIGPKGEIILSVQLRTTERAQLHINTNQLAAGLYLCTTRTSDGKLKTFRFIKS